MFLPFGTNGQEGVPDAVDVQSSDDEAMRDGLGLRMDEPAFLPDF